MDVARPPAPGEIFAGYRIEALVAHGGMGDVYRARDVRLDRPVALKVLAEPRASDPAFRERLLQESRLAASLDHPNVIPVYDAREENGRLYLAMRWVHGTDMRSLLHREGALPPARALALAAQIADALDAAHARGLVHRDVKPSNVLVDETDGRDHCYLADFGLTRGPADEVPTDGGLMGTIDYVAPEQVRGEAVDGRADQYGLACLIFASLAGTPPFSGHSDVATIFAHLEEAPPPLSSLVADASDDLDAAVARGMAKDPAERFDSCAALVAELRRAAGLDARPARPRRLVLVGLAALVATGAAAAAFVVADNEPATQRAAGSIVALDARTGKETARHALPVRPGSVVAGAGTVWVAAYRDGSLWRLDTRAGPPVRTPSVGNPRDLTMHEGRVFVGADGPEQFTGNVASYDARNGARGPGVKLNVCSITAGAATGVWASGCPNVERLAMRDGRLRVARRVTLPYPRPLTSASYRGCQCDMVTSGRDVWVAGDALDPRVWRIDGRTTSVTATVRVPNAPRSLAVAGGGVWVTGPLDDVAMRIDARTARVTDRVRVGRGAAGIAADERGVWVANELDGTVTRIDPRTRRTVATVEVGGRPTEVAAADGRVWVTVDER